MWRSTSIVLLLMAVAACTTTPGGDAATDPNPTPSLPDSLPPRTASFSDQGLSASLKAHRTSRIRAVVANLPLRQKIGQRLITWVDSTVPDARIESLISLYGLGGVILYPRNVEDRDQVTKLCAGLQDIALGTGSGLGLFVAVDQEGGRVTTLRLPDITRFPSAFTLGGYHDPEVLEAAAFITGTELRALGCNMNFAPVLDLSPSGGRGIIGDRALGNDPRRVGLYGQAYLDGMRRAGVIAVIKHAPGHGATSTDSHGSLPVVDLSTADLLATHFVPFRMAIEHGAEALMTAHILFPRIDPDYPVTLSRKMITGGLRETMGYDGVVITDGMAMKALADNYSVSESLRLMIRAGTDIILVHSTYDVAGIVEHIVHQMQSGAISEHEITRGAERVIALKARYGLVPAIPPVRLALPPRGLPVHE